MPDALLSLIERQQEKHGPAFYRAKQARLLRKAVRTPSYRGLQDLCATAYSVGKTIDMGGIVYGPAHWEQTGFVNRAPEYYYFLAGLVRTQQAKTIVEIGTWYGGSTRAMLRGFETPAPGQLIVTVDPQQRNLEAFRDHPEIVAIEGDAAEDRIVEQVAARVQPRLDILFVDGDHRYGPTKAVVEKYCHALRPKWMVFDDIHFRWSMEKTWARALRCYPGVTYDVGNGIGFQAPKGFGIIDCREIDRFVL
jgi:predicted O-methyltransferase YrrM